MSNTVIVSTEPSDYIARLIAQKVDDQLEPFPLMCEFGRFGDQERKLRLMINSENALVGQNAIIVGSTHNDEAIMDMVAMGNKLASLGTRRRVFVIPFFGYSTAERVVQPGDIPMAKVVTLMFSHCIKNSAGNIFLMLDLHVDTLVSMFEGDCQPLQLEAGALLLDAIRSLNLANFVIGSADMGRPKWVKYFANELEVPHVFAFKSRSGEKTHHEGSLGDVTGKSVVIYDDMTRSAGSLIGAAEEYKERGAKDVYAVLSHCALTDENVIEKLKNSCISHIITTNSHPMSNLVQNDDRFTVIDISSVFANVIPQYLR